MIVIRHCSILVLLAFLAGTGGAVAQSDATRTVTGTVSYRERIALPDDARIIVEARDARDRVLAEARMDSAGRQVPFDFALEIPRDTAVTLRAAITVGGQTRWVGPQHGIEPGAQDRALDPLVLVAHVPMGFASDMQCGDRRIRVGFAGPDAVVAVGSAWLRLGPVPAASGAKFADPADEATYFWSRGERATLSLGGVTLPECVLVPPRAEGPYIARGQEPGWTLTIADGALELVTDYGAARRTAPLPDATFVAGAFTYDLADPALRIRIAPELCRDAATGMPHPETVTITRAAGRLDGCGGAPLSLLTGAPWRITEIEGTAVPTSAEVTLWVDPTGRATGSSGCNRYSAPLTLTGEGISFGTAAATMMACPTEAMALERRFLDALARVDRFDFAADGALVLISDQVGAPVLRARRD